MILTAHGEAIAMGVKSHVLYSRLLKGEDYHDLLASGSIAEIAGLLKTTEAYRTMMETLPPSQTHRVDLESAVRNSIMTDAESFIPYLNGARQAVFDDWLSLYEAENLKSVFRWIRSRRLDRDQLRLRLYPVPGSTVPYDLLLNSRDFTEALEALRETKYYRPIIAPVKRLNEGEESLFSLELAIDNFIEMRLYKDLQKLGASELALLHPFFGSRTDLINIYNLIRCLLYYRMSLEETLSRMLPVKYKIKTHHLREIAKGITWEDRLYKLAEFSPVYADIFSGALKEKDFDLAMEMSMKRFYYLKTLAIFHTGSPGFHTAMAYFLLKSYEVDDVIRMIEDVRYDYDRSSATRKLIRSVAETGGEQAWR